MRFKFDKLKRERCGDIGVHLPHFWLSQPFLNAIGTRRFCPGKDHFG
jgi:hypothetical protein